MPFNPAFTCLWCGARHTVRGPDDVEGWARLCPDCVGRAGDNGFLSFRLRQALIDRGAAARAAPAPAPEPAGSPSRASASPPDSPDVLDDRYLRRGRFARGPIHDAAWNAELDAAGRWLDALPVRGEIVELAAGTGWWSALLAGKGSLSVYDEEPARLDRARERLVAHRLRAHLHVRDRWAQPDRSVDALFIGPAIAEIASGRLADFLAIAHRWLVPGGVFAAIDLLPDRYAFAADETARPAREGAVLAGALVAAGFTDVQTVSTGRFFTLAAGRA